MAADFVLCSSHHQPCLEVLAVTAITSDTLQCVDDLVTKDDLSQGLRELRLEMATDRRSGRVHSGSYPKKAASPFSTSAIVIPLRTAYSAT